MLDVRNWADKASTMAFSWWKYIARDYFCKVTIGLLKFMNQMPLKHVSDSSVLTVWVFWRDCNSAHCLVNKSLSTGIFPSYAKGERERWLLTLINVLKHFRPVSNQPFVSRLMEKIVLDLFIENSIKYIEMNWYCLKLPRRTMKWWQNNFWRHYDKNNLTK